MDLGVQLVQPSASTRTEGLASQPWFPLQQMPRISSTIKLEDIPAGTQRKRRPGLTYSSSYSAFSQYVRKSTLAQVCQKWVSGNSSLNSFTTAQWLQERTSILIQSASATWAEAKYGEQFAQRIMNNQMLHGQDFPPFGAVSTQFTDTYWILISPIVQAEVSSETAFTC